MKKYIFAGICLAFILSISPVFAAQFKDQKDYVACKHCGMDRTKFAHSRMLVEYDDGKQVGTCSLHCTTKELKHSDGNNPVAVMVADYYTHKLLNADDAVWVVGGDRKGVMTMRAKWAFESSDGAQRFIAEHGGKTASADDARKASRDDMAKDMERMRQMKAMKKKKMDMN